MTKSHASFSFFTVHFNTSASRAYYNVVRSAPSLIFSLFSLAIFWPRIQMAFEFSSAAGNAWFSQQFCYSLVAWCALGIIATLFWLLVVVFPHAVFMKLVNWCVTLRTAAWYCTLPGFLFLYIKVTSITCYMNMHIFLFTLLGGLVLLFLAGVYSFRLYSLCRVTADMQKTLSCGVSDQAFGYSFNMTAANLFLAAAALFAADLMSDYSFISAMLSSPYSYMLEALNAWMDVLTSSVEVCILDYYFDIPWVAILTAVSNIPMISVYKRYMKASQEPSLQTSVEIVEKET